MRKLLLVALAALLGAAHARAAAVVWTGGASGDWKIAANWTPAIVPGVADAVSIPSGTVVAYSTDPALGVASLTLGAPAILPLAVLELSTGLAVGGTLSLQDGAAIQVSTLAPIAATDITLLAGTSVAFTVAPTVTGTAPTLRLYATGSFTVAAGATVTVAGRGYSGGVGVAAGFGPGLGGAGSGSTGGGGGGHGGAAGNGGAAVNGGGVNDALKPVQAGSGGGGSPSADGAHGGGAVSVLASTITIDGLINADGDDAVSIGFEGAGGGAGGAIVLDAAVIRGAGVVSARGGVGGTAANFGGGGGGGGRVWAHESAYEALGSSLTVRVTGGNFGAGGTFGGSGQTGTEYFDPRHWTNNGGTNFASNPGNWSAGVLPLGGERLVFGASETAKYCAWDLAVAPSSATILPQFSTTVALGFSLTVNGSFDMAAGTVTAAGGVVLSVDGGLNQSGGRLNLSASTIAVSASGGARTVSFYDASAQRFVVGGVAPASATVSGFLSVSSRAHINALAQLTLSTGVLSFSGDGPFTGAGGVTASTGQWIYATGVATQTWTMINGNFGSLRVVNTSAGGLLLSTAAGAAFSLTGGMTVDPAAVLRASATALGVGGNWSVLGTAVMGQSTTTLSAAAGSTSSVITGGGFDNLIVAGPGTIALATTTIVSSTLTVTGGNFALGAATISVRGNWKETGGVVIPGTSRAVFDGAGAQSVTALPGSSFAAFVSSSAGGMTIGGPLNATAQFEWHRGLLDFSGRALSIGGDMTPKGGILLTYAGSTVTFSGTSTQTVTFALLDGVVIDNPNPVRLGLDSTWGNFTINPGRYFDGSSRLLTITGDRWSSGGANYNSIPPFHLVTWTPPSSITIGAGSVIAGKVSLSVNKTAILQGSMTVTGAGYSFDPRQGSTVVNAPGGSTITFSGSSDFGPSSGANWFYAGDVANSWFVFTGTGGARGAFISTNTLGSIQVNISSISIFQAPDLNLLGSFVLSTGIVRPVGAKTIVLGGDFLQQGGTIDFNTASTGTIRFAGSSTQTMSLLPGTSIWNLVETGTGTVIAASPVRVIGDFGVTAGTFQAGGFNHFLLSNVLVGAGGAFAGQGSTVTLNGAVIGKISQSVSFFGNGAFHGLVQAVSSVTLQTSTTMDVFTDAVAASTLAVTPGSIVVAGDFRMGTASGTPLRLRSTTAGLPWSLKVLSVSSVTRTSVSDSDASTGLTVPADDGFDSDLGGNANWDFTPNLLVLLPGETFTPGVAPGKTGAPSVSTAGVAITVTVRAVSSRFDPVTRATETVTLTTNDPGTVAPAPAAMVLGTTSFTLTPRGAEPSPRMTTVTASAAFASGNSILPVTPDALMGLQVIMPGETAAPGTLTGKTGTTTARVKGVPFSATVRAVDSFWNVVSTITHTTALTISAASATLPAPQALVAGQLAYSGLIVYATGTFTLSATDVTQPFVQSATSAVFGVSPPSLSSPSVTGFVPTGARVATFNGGPQGLASDGSAVEVVSVDLRDLDAGLHFDWNAQSFGSVVPFFATAALGAPLGQSTTWFIGAVDAAFADGHHFRLTVQATNPTGLMAQATSTFTFDRGMLAFGAKDGQGTAAVLPAAAAGCEEQVSTITFTVGLSGIGRGGALAIRAPEGWSLPVGTTTQYPPSLGYWHATSTSLASSIGSTFTLVSPAASGSVPLGPGWFVLGVATNSAQSFLSGQRITLTYRARPPMGPLGRGPQPFLVMTRGDAGGTLLPVSTAPVTTLTAGTTSFLTFADQTPLSLTPLTASGTMQLLVADLCGNATPGVSSGTVALTLSLLTPGGPVKDGSAVFRNAAGGPISSVGLSTGLAASASPSFSVTTSTDAPAELVLRATATFSGLGFSPLIVEATRPVRLRALLPVFTAVSVDTGTPAAGTTSAVLSAADPSATAAQIRFSLADPDLIWDATVSSDAVSFSSPVLSAVGTGDPARGLVLSWDGVDRTRIPPIYVAGGRYKVRLRAGGGAALDRTVEIVVPPTAGYAGRLGARGAGAFVRASGPGAGSGRWAVASSTGYFELRGLRPGQAYELTASTDAVALGRAITLSTTVAGGAAATALTDLGVLSFPATSYLRVSLQAPAPAPRESIGSFTARYPDGTAAFTGSLRLSSAAASSDDAGPLFGRAASTWSVVAAAPGVYDVDVDMPELGLSTRAAGVVVTGAGTDLAVNLLKKANVFGYAVLPTTTTFGSFVSVQAIALGAADPSAFGGAFVSSVPSPSGPSSAAYSLFGLDPGSWTIVARAPGYSASSVTILIAGTGDVAGLNLTPGLGAKITGSLAITGDARGATQCFPAAGGAAASCPAGALEVEIEALGVGRLDRQTVRLRLGAQLAFSSAAFTLTGLDAGAYALRASLPGFALTPAQGSTVTVTAGGTAAAPALTLAKIDARARVDIAVPPLPGGACRSTSSYRSLGLLIEPDGGAPLVYGDATALAPTAVSARSQINAATGAFEYLNCSSVTVFTPALPAGGARVTALFAPTGGLARGRAALSDGTTAALSLDMTGSTYAVTGSLSYFGLMAFSTRAAGVPVTVAVSSIPGIVNTAPSVSLCVLGSANPVSLSALRAELLPYDGSYPPIRRSTGTAAGLCAAPAASTAPAASAAFLGSINADGSFAFAGVPPGLYLLRVPGELDEDFSDGPEAAEASALVTVGTSPVTASLRLSRGRRVSGRIAAPSGLAAGRTLRVSLFDANGATVRTADVSCGATGVSYTLDGVADGRYRLGVADLAEPVVWTAAPMEVVVGGADLDGRDAVLTPAATIRARLSLARPLPGGAEEHVLVSRENAYLLPRGFTARAMAVPYGSAPPVVARPAADGSIVDADGRVVIEGLLPGSYDVEFSGSEDGAPGAVSFAPARVSGVAVAAGQAADLGVVPLFGGAAAVGLVVDALSGLPLAGAVVSARASIRSGVDGVADGPSATADSAGRYALKGLSPVTRWYDLTATAAGHAAQRVSSVDLSSGATQNFALASAAGTATGRVVAADASPLFSSLGAAEAPGAALFLQRAGVLPVDDPLADLSLRTDPDGRFTIPSLATGSYRLVVAATGLASLTRAITLTGATVDLGTMTLTGGGTLSGSLRLPDGSPVPDDELRAVVATTPDLSEYIYGSLTRDAGARASTAYKIGGLRAGRTYRVLALSAFDEAAMPPEAAAVVLTSTSDARVLDLVIRPAAPTVSARSRRAGTRETVEFQFSRPLRARSASDDDPSLVVTTASASGVLSGWSLSIDRRRLTVAYDPGVGESSFTLRAAAPTTALDYDATSPSAPRERVAVATASFFTGETGAHGAVVANAVGAVLASEGDAGRLVLPRGVFSLDASSSVAVNLRRASVSTGVSAASLPTALRAAAASLPATLPAQSDFYEIELPAGVPAILARPAQLTLVYSSAIADPSALNLYWYNPGSGQYVLQPDALGAAPAYDAAARSVTYNVGHFSTFVLLASGAGAIGGAANSGADLEAYNFPNPFDLQIKTVTTIHGAGSQTIRGTMIRVAVPPNLSGQGKLRVFDSVGRLIRTIDMGALSAGQSYYQGWDGCNDSGRDVASGLYVGQVEIGSKRKTFKMAVIK